MDHNFVYVPSKMSRVETRYSCYSNKWTPLINELLQLLISYTELLETRERRRSHLSRVYSFQCSCSRCSGEDEVTVGLLAAAREDIANDVIKDSIREGLLKLDKDVAELKKAKG